MSLRPERMLSRRAMLRTMLTAGATGVLAACGQATSTAPAAEAPVAVGTAASTERGTLRLAHTLEWAGKEVLAPASPARFFPPVSLLYSLLVRLA
ncbi:hypothetical protein HC891_08630, partial [Candidatus Gracilibacteria bacterium]|nr:hypothetical protein [Candidatus Gracilibacteria bacterium]